MSKYSKGDTESGYYLGLNTDSLCTPKVNILIGFGMICQNV